MVDGKPQDMNIGMGMPIDAESQQPLMDPSINNQNQQPVLLTGSDQPYAPPAANAVAMQPMVQQQPVLINGVWMVPLAPAQQPQAPQYPAQQQQATAQPIAECNYPEQPLSQPQVMQPIKIEQMQGVDEPVIPDNRPMQGENNRHVSCAMCYNPETTKINGKYNECSHCSLKWCQMCFQNITSEGSDEPGFAIKGCGFLTNKFCTINYYLRFGEKNGERYTKSCLFFWPLSFLVAFTYPAWGCLYAIGIAIYLNIMMLAVSMYQQAKCFCKQIFLPFFCLFSLIFMPHFMIFGIVLMFIPGLLYCWWTPCLYGCVPLKR